MFKECKKIDFERKLNEKPKRLLTYIISELSEDKENLKAIEEMINNFEECEGKYLSYFSANEMLKILEISKNN